MHDFGRAFLFLNILKSNFFVFAITRITSMGVNFFLINIIVSKEILGIKVNCLRFFVWLFLFAKCSFCVILE